MCRQRKVYDLMLICRVRYGIGVVALWAVVTGCGSDTQAASHGHDHDEASGVNQPSITTVPLREASASEQQAFDQMYDGAMVDGEMSGSELEMFALEAVQCTKRAGFEATLLQFDSKTGDAAFSVASDGPDGEGPGERAADECETTFYLPAVDLFDQSHGPTAEEAQFEQEQSEMAVLSCLAEAGFDFDDALDGLASGQIPEEVREACVQAYFE